MLHDAGCCAGKFGHHELTKHGLPLHVGANQKLTQLLPQCENVSDLLYADQEVQGLLKALIKVCMARQGVKLRAAAYNDDYDAVDLLLLEEEGRQELLESPEPGTGRTALHIAAEEGQQEVTKVLLDYGACCKRSEVHWCKLKAGSKNRCPG